VLDGELLVLIDGWPDFDSLHLRMHSAESRVKKLSAEIPPILMCFDLLIDAKGKDLRGKAFENRARPGGVRCDSQQAGDDSPYAASSLTTASV
jgi:ATP-dependent DNA ligase